jgi:guanylate kinase
MSSNPGGARRALLIIVSAPSGAGKTTLCQKLRAEFPELVYSISCTTRAPRGKEQDGREYHFLSEAEFLKRVGQGAFLEHALVHGNRYGTLRQAVADALAAGQSVLMDIDVQGAAQIREYVRKAAGDDPIRRAFVDIFIEPPSMEALQGRIEGRGENRAEDTQRRLKNAAEEMRHRFDYRHRVVNDVLEDAYVALRAVIETEWRK